MAQTQASQLCPAQQDHMVPNAAETSDLANSVKDSSKEKPEGESEFHKKELPHLAMSNKNYCYVCGKPQSKISRHLKTLKTYAEIVHAFSLSEQSKECKILLEKMRNMGNYRCPCKPEN